MKEILCPQCGHPNPMEAVVCDQCNANLNAVRSIVDNANNHYNEALSLAHEGRLDEAIGQLEAAIALASNNPVYYNLLGTIYAQKGLFSEAIRSWERCLALDPEMEKAFENIDKARRLEETRADEFEEQPHKLNQLITTIAMILFFVTSLLFGVNSYVKSRQVAQLRDDADLREKEALSWKSQFDSLNAQFPADGINGVLKKITQSETLLQDRDKRIQDLEQQVNKTGENYRDRINDFRDKMQELQKENESLKTQLKTIDQLKEVITQNDTEIGSLKENTESLKKSLDEANKRVDTYKNNLLLAQQNIKELQGGREQAIETVRKMSDKNMQELHDQILEMRDEIAEWQRKSDDRQYADRLVTEALGHLSENDFDLASQNIETALERVPTHPIALYLQEQVQNILGDPLEQELRRYEKEERQSRRESIRGDLVTRMTNHANDLYNKGQYNDAVEQAQRVLKLKPDNTSTVAKLKDLISQSDERNKEIVLLLLQARKEVEAKNFKEADEKLQQVLLRSPGNEEAKTLLKQIVQ